MFRREVYLRLLCTFCLMVLELYHPSVPVAKAQTVRAGRSASLGCNAEGKAENIGININNLNWAALRSDNFLSALEKSGAGWKE